MLGIFENGKLRLDEIHRFATGGIPIRGSLRWDVLRFYDEIVAGLRKAARLEMPVTSVSADSWGVDYVLLRDGEPLLTLPYHYRDVRTDNAYASVFPRASAQLIFSETGLQFMTINTLYQLNADREKRPAILEAADGFLNIGDYFNYLMSGRRAAEVSLASTTQIYNPRTRAWSEKLATALALPARIFPPIVPSGTVLGPLEPGLAKLLGWGETQVVATCSHDTGAAVAAVPAEGSDWAFLSSGTWSLLGAELPEPVINEAVREANFTNEAGCGHTIRFLKNIVGLWILQECRRAWAETGRDHTYEELVDMGSSGRPLRSLIHPDWPPFGKPGDMPGKIAAFCERTGQPVPERPGDYVRCILESLALLYADVLDRLDQLTGRITQKLHIVGGGSRNVLLNQLAANATGRTVLAGPVEATAIGNVLIQAVAAGHLRSLADLRQVVGQSFPVTQYQPLDADSWRGARARFSSLALPVA
jgi:rhamnulokinase